VEDRRDRTAVETLIDWRSGTQRQTGCLLKRGLHLRLYSRRIHRRRVGWGSALNYDPVRIGPNNIFKRRSDIAQCAWIREALQYSKNKLQCDTLSRRPIKQAVHEAGVGALIGAFRAAATCMRASCTY
jgi:hypothetical protein